MSPKKIVYIMPSDVPSTIPATGKKTDGINGVGGVLAHALAKLGAEVHLFASGDSECGPNVYMHPTVPVAFCNDPDRRFETWPFVDPATRTAIADQVMHDVAKLGADIVHNHDASTIPSVVPGDAVITTVHTCLYPLPYNRHSDADICARYPEHPLISVSKSQQGALPDNNWLGCVHNGVPVDRFTYQRQPDMIDPYILFIGRIHPEKGTALAIRTVVKLNKRGVRVKLKIAGGCALGSQEYFDETVLRALKEYPDIVEYKGEVDFDEKDQLYGGALLTIAPLGCELAGRAWYEPNGLTIGESLSCGTPVLVGNKASAPELVQHKSTGFRVPIQEDDSDEVLAERFADGAEWIMTHPMRKPARRYAERWFTVERMVKGYQAMYRKFLSGDRAYAFAQ